ncbi:MAG: response regulator [Chloroflexi bacterium]|nr:response regulator [Chloroflexota bacterium]
MSDFPQTGHLGRDERRMSKISLDGWKVLVVEDQVDNMAVVQATLEFNGAQVQTAHNGIEGLQALESFTPTLILMDLSMPEMSGWEMFEKVRADDRFADVPVIALTAHAMEGDQERVMEAGFDGYIPKPFSVMKIVSDIQDILNSLPQKTRDK